MTLEEYKMLDDVLLDEINVKELHREMWMTEHGQLTLVYTRATRAYSWHLGGTPMATPTPRLDARISEILASCYERAA